MPRAKRQPKQIAVPSGTEMVDLRAERDRLHRLLWQTPETADDRLTMLSTAISKIDRQIENLERISEGFKQKQPIYVRTLKCRYTHNCFTCGKVIKIGDDLLWDTRNRQQYHPDCYAGDEVMPTITDPFKEKPTMPKRSTARPLRVILAQTVESPTGDVTAPCGASQAQ